MVNEIINNRSQLIDKKVFEEYYQNEHRKTLLIYRIGIIFLLLINVILLIFYFLYKYQISNTKNNRGTRLPYSGGSRLHFKARGQGVYIKAS